MRTDGRIGKTPATTPRHPTPGHATPGHAAHNCGQFAVAILWRRVASRRTKVKQVAARLERPPREPRAAPRSPAHRERYLQLRLRGWHCLAPSTLLETHRRCPTAGDGLTRPASSSWVVVLGLGWAGAGLGLGWC